MSTLVHLRFGPILKITLFTGLWLVQKQTPVVAPAMQPASPLRPQMSNGICFVPRKKKDYC